MSIKDITQNVIYKVKADTRDAARAFDNLGSAVDGATDDVKEMGATLLDTRSRWEKFADGAKSAMGGVADKTNSAFASLKSGASSAADGVDSIAKAMAPWNQAIELGGKVINGLNAGLDAYAKTSPQAAKEVQHLKSEFSDLKDSVLAAAGSITVDLLDGLNLFELHQKAREQFLREHLKGYAERADAQMEGAKILLKFANVGQVLADARDAFVEGTDKWDDSPLAKIRALIESHHKKQEDEAKRHADAMKAYKPKLSDYAVVTGTDTVGQQIGWTTPGSLGSAVGGVNVPLGSAAGNNDAAIGTAYQGTKSAVDAVVDNAMTAGDRYQEYIERLSLGGQTLLEKLGLADPSAYDTAIAVLQSLSTAWQESLEAIATSEQSLGTIFKKGASVVIHALGDKLAANSAAEFIEAGAHAFLLDFSGSARHAAAGALYSAGAIAAYASASKLGGGGSGSAPAKPATASGGSGGNSISSQGVDRGSQSGDKRPIYIINGSAFDDSTPRMRAVMAREQVDKALRERDEQ